jgi:hypothetical protein
MWRGLIFAQVDQSQATSKQARTSSEAGLGAVAGLGAALGSARLIPVSCFTTTRTCVCGDAVESIHFISFRHSLEGARVGQAGKEETDCWSPSYVRSCKTEWSFSGEIRRDSDVVRSHCYHRPPSRINMSASPGGVDPIPSAAFVLHDIRRLPWLRVAGDVGASVQGRRRPSAAPSRRLPPRSGPYLGWVEECLAGGPDLLDVGPVSGTRTCDEAMTAVRCSTALLPTVLLGRSPNLWWRHDGRQRWAAFVFLEFSPWRPWLEGWVPRQGRLSRW